jgi:lysosomal Pro-X carboxypeptidase
LFSKIPSPPLQGPLFDPFDYYSLCPYNLTTSYLDTCTSLFGNIGYNSSLFRPKWIYENYGTEYPTATNLIFSNGFLDPWSGGGWRLNNTQEGSLVSLIIKDGAHHYDLRGQHPNDTEAVKEVRKQEK